MVRYGELALKGKNRYHFEKTLVRNIKDCLDKTGNSSYEVIRLRGRILVRGDVGHAGLKRVFGISSYSPCTEARPSMDAIKSAIDITRISQPFRVTCTRSDKSYPFDSMQVQREIGSYIVGKTGYSVDLENYNSDVGVELVDDIAYIYYETFDGFSGLPVGTQGTVIGLIRDLHDELACLLLMRRGCNITLVLKADSSLKLLDSYNYRAFTKTHVAEDPCAFLSGRHEIAVCSGSRGLNLPETGGKLFLQPLVGYSDEELETLKQRFIDGCDR